MGFRKTIGASLQHDEVIPSERPKSIRKSLAADKDQKVLAVTESGVDIPNFLKTLETVLIDCKETGIKEAIV